jgi:hypothetical protein
MHRRHLALIVAAGAALPALLRAQNANWTYSPGGEWTANWQNASNWSPNSAFPNGSSAVVTLPPSSIGTGSGTIVVSGAGVTVNRINFNGAGTNTNGYTIGGDGKLLIANGGTINVASSGPNIGVATLAAPFGVSANGTFYKIGSGMLVLSGTGNFSGLSGIAVTAGTLRITNSAAFSNLSVISTANDGQVEIQNASNSGTLMLGAGSSLPHPSGVIYSSAGNNVWTGNWVAIAVNNSVGVISGTTFMQIGFVFDGNAPQEDGFAKVGGGTFSTTSLWLNGPMHINDGTLVLRPGDVSMAASFDIAGGSAPIARLDITSQKVVVHSDSSASIKALIHAGENGGAWNGYGISSSIAQADAAANGTTTYAVGYVKGSQLPDFNGSTATFGGITLGATDVAMTLTRVGDTNLDGVVDTTSDFNNFVSGYTAPHSALPNTDWFNGDFDHDGVITLGSDFSLFAEGFAGLGGSLTALSNAVTTSTLPPADQQTMQTIISNTPEPGMVALGMISGALAILRRRRRN